MHRNEREATIRERHSGEQIEVVFDLCTALVEAYEVGTIVGHEGISPDGKIDRGPASPLDELREGVLIATAGATRPRRQHR